MLGQAPRHGLLVRPRGVLRRVRGSTYDLPPVQGGRADPHAALPLWTRCTVD